MVDHGHRHIPRLVVLVNVLVRRAEHARAPELSLAKGSLDLESRPLRTVLPQPPTEFLPLFGVDRCRVSRAGVIAVFVRIEAQEFWHPGIDCSSQSPDEHPPVLALEGVVRLKSRSPI